MSLIKLMDEHWAIRNPLIYIPMKAYFDEKMNEFEKKHEDCCKRFGLCVGDTAVVSPFREYVWAHFLLGVAQRPQDASAALLQMRQVTSIDDIKALIDDFFHFYEWSIESEERELTWESMSHFLEKAKENLVQNVMVHAVVLYAFLIFSRFFSMPTQISISIGAFIGTAYGLYREKIFRLFRKNEDK